MAFAYKHALKYILALKSFENALICYEEGLGPNCLECARSNDELGKINIIVKEYK